jgi:hypothetical protein
MADNRENSASIAENSQQMAITEGEQEPSVEEPAPKKRGRPVGARDRAPRKPRTVIVEHTYEYPPAPPPAVQEKPKQEPEPQSPRSVFKQCTDVLTKLNEEREKARRAYWADTIARSLR